MRGPLEFVRHVDVSGNTRTVDRVIRREVQLVEGQLYSARSIRNTKARLDSLGFFEEVNVEDEATDAARPARPRRRRGREADRLALVRRRLLVADSFVLSGSVAQNNLFGRGYGLRLAADIGGQRDRFYATFTNRRLFDSEYSFSASAYRTDAPVRGLRRDHAPAST